MSYQVYFCTCPKDIARKLASSLVETKLAACVNILPEIYSVFSWEDKVDSEIEALLIIKSLEKNFQSLCDFIQSTHPYDCPELISIDIKGGLPDYLKWMQRVLA